MTTTTKPALSASSVTKLHNEGGVTSIPVLLKRRVTYYVQCVTAESVSLPYVIAVNGRVLDAFAKRAGRVESGKKKDPSGKVVLARGEFTLMAEPGAKVALFLNSDASPQFRQQPVYEVMVGERDIEVHITEKPGRHKDTAVPVLEGAGVPKTGALKEDASSPKVDRYAAALTGDIWMKVSHKYTADEVDARLPEGTTEIVKAAIKKIYGGLSSATLEIAQPAQAGKPASTLRITFSDSNNPKENINSYSLLSDGLQRVHPGGYAALINAALDAEVQTLSVSSCWRPMLGSIAHRAGLGLDVSVVGGTIMNRQELRRSLKASKTAPNGNGNDKDNVTDAEVKAFGEYEQALVDKKRADAELESAKKALTAAKKAGDAGAVQRGSERQEQAEDDVREAAKVVEEKKKKWSTDRNKGEPNHVHQYRASLFRCVCVKQLFDPWFMDANTRDASEPDPNMQKSGNETLHAHHLHITVDDPKIL